MFGMNPCNKCGRQAYLTAGLCTWCNVEEARLERESSVDELRKNPDFEQLDDHLDEWYA